MRLWKRSKGQVLHSLDVVLLEQANQPSHWSVATWLLARDNNFRWNAVFREPVLVVRTTRFWLGIERDCKQEHRCYIDLYSHACIHSTNKPRTLDTHPQHLFIHYLFKRSCFHLSFSYFCPFFAVFINWQRHSRGFAIIRTELLAKCTSTGQIGSTPLWVKLLIMNGGGNNIDFSSFIAKSHLRFFILNDNPLS